MSEKIAKGVPLLPATMQLVNFEQLALVSQVVGDSTTHESVRLLFNLAVNDFRDLLDDIETGSGRSAMRAARSVIEHAINLRTVTSSLAEASRYAEHLDLGPAMMVDLEPGADRLNAAARRKYTRALRKAGVASKRRFNAAVAEHGHWFSRNWTKRTLKDRATVAGLEHLYTYYKLGSLVSHGSAAGSLGTVFDSPNGFRIFRTGLSLELAPVAMWAGIAGYREVLSALQAVRPDLEVDAYSDGLDALDGLWAEYFTALAKIDRALWPTAPVEAPSAVLAFTQSKVRRWYLHLPMTGALIRAKTPDLPAWMEDRIDQLVDRIVTEQPDLFRPDQRWVTARVANVTVTPEAHAEAIPDTALFQSSPSGFVIRDLPSLD
ncbi:hypothetical protein SAMN04489867_3150 [Pedococcus dokdonensis]|uniref:Uncharacterized protein n=1 Tax=Pedococcus dokdonensis TaxID=443156 RepID=A0A1H0U5W3_9MICO|nr:DUF5677 domain-containing protein [Pedococcus dokdonensis]SDP61573.1 hypothetical protein SAMN04489867_3150 [Pedococcus dokdonensis]